MKGTRWIAAFTICALNGSIMLVDVAHADGNESTTRVYQCIRDGQRIFSDQPCGADAAQREVEVVNRMEAVAARGPDSSRHPASRTTSRRARHAGDDSADDTQKRCRKIEADKENLTARMRTGYSGAQGERWRERLRKLNDQYFELRCSRY